MQKEIKKEIKRLSKRAFSKEAAKTSKRLKHKKKFERRTGTTGKTSSAKPPTSLENHFNPIYCARNANFISKTIWKKIVDFEYKPKPAINYKIPKATGGTRSIMAFSIPDTAVANIMLRKVRNRNLKRLSPSSYAYHPQKNVFDAILALRSYISDEKLFAVQIDFEKYFDSIPSAYLKNCIDDPSMLSITPHERAVFKEFLYHQYAETNDYKSKKFSRRVKGTPQGASVSLLLANMANHNLDLSLERCPGKFVRFADDIVALCNTYSEAQEIESCFVKHCANSGLIINEEKSPGVTIISRKKAEIRSYDHFDFLGYRLTNDGLSMPERVEKRIKSKISRLVHIYLIQHIEKHGFNPKRQGLKPNFDWELLGLITEIRKYLYGGLTEEDIFSFLDNGKRLPKMRGLMGFYAILDDSAALRRIDGWMVNSVKRAMKKRASILQKSFKIEGLTPTEKDLITGVWLSSSAWQGDNLPDSGLPSLVRGWRAARKYYFTFGLENVEAPEYFAYY